MTNAGLEQLAAGPGDPRVADGAGTSLVDERRQCHIDDAALVLEERVRPALRLLRLLAVAPLLALVWLYRTLISPVLPPACRYYPSCAAYAQEALIAHGPLRGSWLSLRRLLRCHPWCVGGPDPVPPPRSRPALSRST